jgi:hypothetical protein
MQYGQLLIIGIFPFRSFNPAKRHDRVKHQQDSKEKGEIKHGCSSWLVQLAV